jgi:VWFA-related protein
VPRSAILLPAALIAVASLHAAQQTPPAQPQTPPARPQFAAGIDLVEVDVAVTDKNGQPITDLTAADFEIREDGQFQTIQALYLTSRDVAVLRTAPPMPAAPDVIVPDRRPMKQRLFVFVLDMWHLSAGGFTRSRDAVEGFLKDRLQSGDLVGVVVNGQMLGNRIGSDREALLKALADVKNPNLSRYNEMRTFPRIIDDEEAARIAKNEPRVLDNAVARACREQPGECRVADEMVRQQVEQKASRIAAETNRDTSLSLTALQSLTNGLARLPGPKQVVVFSEGFYSQDTTDWLKSVVAQAARSGVHFSTFDARGTGKDLRSQNFLDAAPVTSTGDLSSIDSDQHADVLTSLALDTGGDRVFNFNNFKEPLDKLVRETSTYYVLGYRPKKAFDGSYRKLEVKVTRPNAVVRARRGYVASLAPVTPAPDVPVPAAGTPAAPSAAAAPSLTLATGRSGIGGSPAEEAGLLSRPNSVNLVTELAASKLGAGAVSASEADRLAHEGWQLYARGKADEAREKLVAAAAIAPKVPWIQYALGQTEFTLQHMDAAAAAFENARRDLPGYEPVYFDLADSYLQLGRQTDALAVLREAERRWPNDSETHNAAGCVLVRRGALDDAAGAFERAIAAAPRDGDAYFNLARTYHLQFIRMLRSTSSNATATSMLADRNRERAVNAYKKYLTIGGPQEKDAREALAALQWK